MPSRAAELLQPVSMMLELREDEASTLPSSTQPSASMAGSISSPRTKRSGAPREEEAAALAALALLPPSRRRISWLSSDGMAASRSSRRRSS